MDTTMSDRDFDTYVANAREHKPAVMTVPTERILSLVDEVQRLTQGIERILHERDDDVPDRINGDYVLADLHDLLRDE